MLIPRKLAVRFKDTPYSGKNGNVIAFKVQIDVFSKPGFITAQPEHSLKSCMLNKSMKHSSVISNNLLHVHHRTKLNNNRCIQLCVRVAQRVCVCLFAIRCLTKLAHWPFKHSTKYCRFYTDKSSSMNSAKY